MPGSGDPGMTIPSRVLTSRASNTAPAATNDAPQAATAIVAFGDQPAVIFSVFPGGESTVESPDKELSSSSTVFLILPQRRFLTGLVGGFAVPTGLWVQLTQPAVRSRFFAAQ